MEYKIQIVEMSNDKTLLSIIIESSKSLSEVQSFYINNWPVFFDLMTMLMLDTETSIKKKTSMSLNVLTSIFVGEEWKTNCITKFTVSEEDKCKCKCKSEWTWSEKLMEELLKKAIKIDSSDDMKNVFNLIEKLIK